MGWLKAIQAAWSMWNGKKFNSGAAITILATAFQQILATQGVNADQAQMMATYIIQGVGAVIMVVGYVHQWIKANAAKKAAAVGKVTGTADNTIAGGTIVKLLVLGLLLFGAVSTQAAVEKVDQPFKYFLSTMGISEDTAFWGATPTVCIPDLIITNSAKNDGGIQVNYFNSVGFGLDYGRYVKSAGKVYETFGGSIFGAVSGNENASLCGDIHFFNRLIGFGMAANFGSIPKSQRFSFLIITGIKPF